MHTVELKSCAGNVLKGVVMCIPHGTGGTRNNSNIKKERKTKIIKPVSQEEFEHGDPDFIDERKTKDEVQENKKSIFSGLFGS